MNAYAIPGISRLFSHEHITMQVCRAFEVTPEEIKSKTRERRVAVPRHVAMYIMRQKGMRVAEVGHIFNRSHCTVIHANKNVQNIIETKDKSYYPQLKILLKDKPLA